MSIQRRKAPRPCAEFLPGGPVDPYPGYCSRCHCSRTAHVDPEAWLARWDLIECPCCEGEGVVPGGDYDVRCRLCDGDRKVRRMTAEDWQEDPTGFGP